MVETYSGCKPDIQLSEIMQRPETAYDLDWIEHLIEGYTELEGFKIPIISRKMNMKDYLGSLMVRIGIHRMDYHFPPGLYLIGEQRSDLPVIVSCNYKLTLDALRTALMGTGYWLLILDTKGVNVWCAAGKGTFGTEELIFQLTKWRIKELLNVKSVILPQLGASRMTPHIIRKLTGLHVEYGPVRADDLDAFLNNNRVASEASRTVMFPWKERLVLTPVEFMMNVRYLLPIYLFMIFWNYINFGFQLEFVQPLFQTLPWLLMMFTGAVLFPLMLPLLPTKPFSTKGMILGLPMVIFVFAYSEWFCLGGNILQWLSWSVAYLLYVGYLALNFTGSTTFTCLSGVDFEVGHFKKVMKYGGIASACMMALSLFL